jgi:hypothetical protein
MWLVVGLFILFVAFCTKYAVSFMLRIPKLRGNDLEVTHQVKGVEANNPTEAMKKAYNTLSTEQKKQVHKVFMNRED